MEETLEGGRGPPRAVAPLERERDEKRAEIVLRRNERKQKSATNFKNNSKKIKTQKKKKCVYHALIIRTLSTCCHTVG